MNSKLAIIQGTEYNYRKAFSVMICLQAQPLVHLTQQCLIKYIKQFNLKPRLDVIIVGHVEASLIYVDRKRRSAQDIGIEVKIHGLDANLQQAALEKLIVQLNNDKGCSGILLQLPLPSHLDGNQTLSLIAPEKDVDGFHPFNKGQHLERQPGFIPCTALGVSRLLRYYRINLAGKHVLVLGRSAIVGKPLAIECLHQNATVTIAHSATANIKELIIQADIIMSATGRLGVVEWTDIHDDQYLIDVGIHRKGASVVGDLGLKPVEKTVAAFTPVPGGVGLMTVNTLMMNTINAYCVQQKLNECWALIKHEVDNFSI